MKTLINNGVYETVFNGTFKSEFKGKHPCIVIKNLKEPDMFYIIPLTSYTKERWASLRKTLCCRIPSTNSIARVDKMQNRHKSQITKRWFKKHELIVPTYDEMREVHKKAIQYLTLSFNKALKSYQKFYAQYERFETLCQELCSTNIKPAEFMVCKKHDVSDGIYVICDLKLINMISYNDVKNILYKFFMRTDIHITYEYVEQKLYIKIKKSYENYLTLCEKYDII